MDSSHKSQSETNENKDSHVVKHEKTDNNKTIVEHRVRFKK